MNVRVVLFGIVVEVLCPPLLKFQSTDEHFSSTQKVRTVLFLVLGVSLCNLNSSVRAKHKELG